jgi:hypothetical protein
MDEQELRLAVFASLRELTLAGRGVVLLVDEAHLLSHRLLEELRLLASLAEAEEPLARVILAGQLSLEEKLADPALEALNQRVACHVTLEPLTREQSIEYIRFRIKWAGGDALRIFDGRALDRIADACNGLPRCLNQLCDHVLLLTYVQEQKRVTEGAVAEALDDLKQLPLQWNTPLAPDIPVDDVDATLDLDSDVALEEIEDTRAPMAGPSSRPVAGTVCFEIGDSALAVDPMTISTDDPATGNSSGYSVEPLKPVEAVATRARQERRRSGLVSLSSHVRPATRLFAEEVVDDRYAALDVQPRRFLRTFEDSAVPESWLPSRQSPEEMSKLPPSPLSWAEAGAVGAEATFDDPRPDELIDELLPMIDDSCGPDARAGHSENFVACNRDYEPHLSDDAGTSFPSIESRMEARILDACLEVQTAISPWSGQTGVTINTCDSGHGLPAGDADSNLHTSPAGYDVIEPVSTDDVETRRAASTSVTHPSERHVPRPKYRHVFSTLRRRLGRSLRSGM